MPIGTFSNRRTSNHRLSNRAFKNRQFSGYSDSPSSGGGGTIGNLIANETFETPTTGFVLGGWSTNVGSGSTVNPAYTVGPINGTQSLRIVQAGDAANAFKSIGSQTEIWGRFRFKIISGNAGKLVSIKDNTNTTLFFIDIDATNVNIWDGTSATSVPAVGTWSLNTAYYCWYHCKIGNGTNSVGEIAFSTSATRPAWASFFNGGANTNMETVYAGNSNAYTWEVLEDDFNVSDNSAIT